MRSPSRAKGYAPAEGADDCYHGVAKFDVATGQQKKSKPNAPSYTSVFGQALTRLADTDPKIVGVTAAMPGGTGLTALGKAHPNRMFDVGIAEQHAVTFAAGMAAGGLKPFCAIYSSFLQRGYDQIVHDVALQRLPVRFCLDRAGLVGADGPTHAGAFDIGYLAALPNMTVMACADEAELVHMMATMAAHDSGPDRAALSAWGGRRRVDLPEKGEVLEIGKGTDRAGGRSGGASLLWRASERSPTRGRRPRRARGIAVTVADARFAKPLDTEPDR